ELAEQQAKSGSALAEILVDFGKSIKLLEKSAAEAKEQRETLDKAYANAVGVFTEESKSLEEVMQKKIQEFNDGEDRFLSMIKLTLDLRMQETDRRIEKQSIDLLKRIEESYRVAESRENTLRKGFEETTNEKMEKLTSEYKTIVNRLEDQMVLLEAQNEELISEKKKLQESLESALGRIERF